MKRLTALFLAIAVAAATPAAAVDCDGKDDGECARPEQEERAERGDRDERDPEDGDDCEDAMR